MHASFYQAAYTLCILIFEIASVPTAKKLPREINEDMDQLDVVRVKIRSGAKS